MWYFRCFPSLKVEYDNTQMRSKYLESNLQPDRFIDTFQFLSFPCSRQRPGRTVQNEPFEFVSSDQSRPNRVG